MRFLAYCCVCLLLPLAVCGQDPPNPDPKPPLPTVSTISAATGVTGTGKRSDPFIFDASVKCFLKITGDAAQWDTEDCPADSEALGNALIFSLNSPGEYVAYAQVGNAHAKAWFVIKGSGPSPPDPKPPTPQTVSQRVKQALTGPTAKTDAVILIAASEKIVEGIDGYANAAQLQKHWGELLAANKWVKGSRPSITAILEEQIPPTTGQSPAFTASERQRISDLFKAIATGAGEVLK